MVTEATGTAENQKLKKHHQEKRHVSKESEALLHHSTGKRKASVPRIFSEKALSTIWVIFVSMCLLIFQDRSCYVTQAGPKLATQAILLPQPQQWAGIDGRHHHIRPCKNSF